MWLEAVSTQLKKGVVWNEYFDMQQMKWRDVDLRNRSYRNFLISVFACLPSFRQSLITLHRPLEENCSSLPSDETCKGFCSAQPWRGSRGVGGLPATVLTLSTVPGPLGMNSLALSVPRPVPITECLWKGRGVRRLGWDWALRLQDSQFYSQSGWLCGVCLC